MLKKCLKRAVVDASVDEDEVVVEAVNAEGGGLVPGVGLDVEQVGVTEVRVLFVLVVFATAVPVMEERILEPFAPSMAACQSPRRASAGGSLDEDRASLATCMTVYAKIGILSHQPAAVVSKSSRATSSKRSPSGE